MCPVGKFISSDLESDHDAPDDCKECESGKYPSSGSVTTTCIPCEEGKFSSSPSEMECTTCAPGKYADDPEGSASCMNCAAGKYSGVGAKQCDLCDAGKFATSESQTCIACEAGKFSTQGLGSCTSCTSPQYVAVAFSLGKADFFRSLLTPLAIKGEPSVVIATMPFTLLQGVRVACGYPVEKELGLFYFYLSARVRRIIIHKIRNVASTTAYLLPGMSCLSLANQSSRLPCIIAGGCE